MKNPTQTALICLRHLILFESKPNTLDSCYDIVSLAKKLSVALKLEFQWMMKIWGNMLLNVFVTATGPVTKERGNQRLQL